MISSQDTKQKGIGVLQLYILVFFLVWTIYEFNFSTYDYSNNIALYIMVRNSIKYIVWTIPVFVFLKYVYKVNPISYLKLNDNVIRGIIWGIVIGFLIVIYHIIRNYLMGGSKFDFSIDIYTWIHRIILIGLTEEVVFRGFILQKLQEGIEFKYANAISSVLFVLIHFPKWYMSGILSIEKTTYFILYTAFVLGFGLLQGYVLKRTKSLWACMIIHSFNNLISTAFKV
ncbi:MAG TPA: type II CAAX endopeptidase family protein [Clostridia bacterium]|nr:type II CAAX endopeptidase family protein [Clostridia bacterium]